MKNGTYPTPFIVLNFTCMKGYPIVLIGLQGERSLVIGGGSVALRKVHGLLDGGASVEVISPQVHPELAALEKAGEITLHQRQYQPGDIAGVRIVIAATDDPEINQGIWQEANQQGCLINVVDDPERSNFIAPAVVRRGDLSLSISTGGASPALAAMLRRQLEQQFDDSYRVLIEVLAELRAILQSRLSEYEQRLEAMQALLASDLHSIIRQAGRQAGMEYGRQILDTRWPPEA